MTFISLFNRYLLILQLINFIEYLEFLEFKLFKLIFRKYFIRKQNKSIYLKSLKVGLK